MDKNQPRHRLPPAAASVAALTVAPQRGRGDAGRRRPRATPPPPTPRPIPPGRGGSAASPASGGPSSAGWTAFPRGFSVAGRPPCGAAPTRSHNTTGTGTCRATGPTPHRKQVGIILRVVLLRFGFRHVGHLPLTDPPFGVPPPGARTAVVPGHPVQPVAHHPPRGYRDGFAGQHQEHGLESVVNVVRVAEDTAADAKDHRSRAA